MSWLSAIPGFDLPTSPKFRLICKLLSILLAIFHLSCVIALLLLAPAPGRAGIREIQAGQNFRTAAESLLAGDTLIVHEGRYAVDRTVAIKVRSSPGALTIIKGADGEKTPLITCINQQSS